MNFTNFGDSSLKYVVCNDAVYIYVQSKFKNLTLSFDEFLHKMVKKLMKHFITNRFCFDRTKFGMIDGNWIGTQCGLCIIKNGDCEGTNGHLYCHRLTGKVGRFHLCCRRLIWTIFDTHNRNLNPSCMAFSSFHKEKRCDKGAKLRLREHELSMPFRPVSHL